MINVVLFLVSKNYCQYHQPRNNLLPSSDMQRACQLANEYAVSTHYELSLLKKSESDE